ncbi:unnamed protein product [Musa hybrid cultivar]
MDPNPLLLLLPPYLSSDPSLSQDFNSSFCNLNTLILSSSSKPSSPYKISPTLSDPSFASVSVSKARTPSVSQYRSILKSLSNLERALIGAAAGGAAGAFTYVCLLPIDAVKTKLQTKGAAQIYSGALDAAIQTFRTQGILGFYRGVSAVLVGSATSSAIYFGTCELGKSLLSKLPSFPPLLIPPTAGAMGNIVSSAIMVPKELITQRMQAGAVGRSWEVLVRILEKDGILGLYAGYSATLLRNLPAGILSYSSFEYLKSFVLSKTGKAYLEPAQSVLCGALAGAISASLTTPLDVVKTRLMTQAHGEVRNKVSETLRQIVMEEGWGGLARGIGPRVLHSACFAALGYFSFETARLAILHHYVHRRDEMVVGTVA